MIRMRLLEFKNSFNTLLAVCRDCASAGLIHTSHFIKLRGKHLCEIKLLGY